MIQVLADFRRQAAAKHGFYLASLWFGVLFDLLKSCLKEHLRNVASLKLGHLIRMVVISFPVILVFSFHVLWFGFGSAFVRGQPLPAMASTKDLLVVTVLGASGLWMTCYYLLWREPASLPSIIQTARAVQDKSGL
jgi:hypothetical protein